MLRENFSENVLSEEFVSERERERERVDGDNVCAAPIMADKDISEFVQSSKNIDADSDDEKEMNNAAPVPTPSEARTIMKLCAVMVK
ncbi:hypothetical protein TNCV_369231 [Trichonephila clavipes]|nr:hypothetical protein TNCV_369231 [Trichonephila clavipes]